MKAGTAQKDITPPVGLKIVHPVRASVGVHDPLFARVLVLEDNAGTAVAIFCFELTGAGFETCDAMRQAVREQTGIEHTILNFIHSHSARALDINLSKSEDATKEEIEWNDNVLKIIPRLAAEAKANAVPVTLRAGRAPTQVGFNRRLANDEGYVYMGDNKEGAVVPWVNILLAEDKDSKKPRAVLFQHAAHPVIVPDTSGLTSADYPGAAVARVTDTLGADVTALFAQGCSGNINGYPLRSTHEKADQAGRKLGDAVLEAIRTSREIKADTLSVRSQRVTLPCQNLPSMEIWNKAHQLIKEDCQRGTESGKEADWVNNEVYVSTMKSMDVLKKKIERGESAPTRRLDANVIMLGCEWCLVAFSEEMFCEYELWVDKHAPFDYTMAMAYTNGGTGYLATDETLALGAKGGYEAGALPCWWAHEALGAHHSPPAVGVEGMIRNAITSLWTAR